MPRKVVFMPHVSEFGWFILYYIRRVHRTQSDVKIVCCRKGQEIYFPTATDFYYDHFDTNPVIEKDRSGSGGRFTGMPQWMSLWFKLQQKFPNHEIINPETINEMALGKTWFEDHFPITPVIDRNLNVDIVIAPRNRELGPDRNWPEDYWITMLSAIEKAGYSYAISGAKDSSYDFSGAKYRTWEFPDASAEIELLQKCKMFVGLNSGVSHLACFLKCPSMIMFRGGWTNPFSSYFKWANPSMIFVPEVDAEPQYMAEKIIDHLEQKSRATILVETSYGEVLDKYSVLELKIANLATDDPRRKISETEKLLLEKSLEKAGKSNFLADLSVLRRINAELWITMDKQRKSEGDVFSALAKDVISLNDTRCQEKDRLNLEHHCAIREVKIY